MPITILSSVLCLAFPCADPAPAAAAATIPVDVSGDWTVRIGPGRIERDGKTAVLARAADVPVAPAVSVTVRDERHERLPLFNPNAGGWAKGARLRGVAAEECTAKGMLDPASLRLKAGPGPSGEVLGAPGDYDIDLEWGTFGRAAGGKVTEATPVWADYVHGLSRIDSVVVGADGKAAIRPGVPAIALQKKPRLEPGDILVAHIWVPGRAARLTRYSVFPVLETAYPEPVRQGPAAAEKLLPRTLEKLRRGERLRVLAWGDSVTDGSYLGDGTKRWQCRFADRLGKRFPGATIEVVHLGWGGRSTDSFLGEPPGSPWNYGEKVLGAKPDLVVSEFVNDAWMDPNTVEAKYGKFLADFGTIGAEWIILTPHYVRPDWMGLDRERDTDDDPRPYVKGLREFAARHGVALADASLRWGRLWRQGIPYTTLLGNVINHPDARGMEIFADALMAIFP